ncbi:uncharacterized protein F5Z01DRAFT_653447 [Emericellopsis atlantica]|uniref:Uncharacterized protein n=1 Tax=Emericellopsis atlantica TaxID=2614577 RepID=A0A9P7ZNI6_9HYPO|nr:uncharacterized protein F5Z01DRAFT_653447 [Emericellopsis atlantica]KAG9254946.1 hypothetical protein F5Z01DRAFT_653447 [Emericellopsis atlantica]
MPRPKRTRQPVAAPDDEEPRGRSRATRRSTSTMQAAEKTRDQALYALATEDPTSTEHDTSIEVGRRATTPSRRDTTGLDLGDSMFGDLDESFDLPRDLDHSSLAAGIGGSSVIKPRSRASSIIGRNDPPIRPSSRGGATPLMSSTLNFGNFKRRPREPSILGTSRKAVGDTTGTTASNTTSTFARGQEESDEEEDLGLTLELEGFEEPEAESTPISHRRRTRASLRQDKEPSPELPDLSKASVRSRKRKSKGDEAVGGSDRPEKMSRTEEPTRQMDVEEEEVIPRTQSSPAPAPGIDVLEAARMVAAAESSSESEDEPELESEARAAPVMTVESDADSDPDTDSSLSELPSPTTLPARLFARPATPDQNYAAPPLSSASEVSDELWPDIHDLAKRRARQANADDDLSNVSSPPSLTHSPNHQPRAARGRSRTRRSPPPLTTADLANLMPKRRQQRLAEDEDNDEYDTTGIRHGEDELSFVDSRRMQNRSTARSASRNTNARNKSKGGSRKRGTSRRQTKTYSRRDVESDKENENEEVDESRYDPVPDETFDGDDQVREYPELKAAAAKFQRVDQWQMEFESADEEDAAELEAR